MYHANAFDLAIMIPYFIVLRDPGALRPAPLLAGLRLLQVCEQCSRPLRPPVTEWPRVTIQLPIYNERYVIERLVEAVSRFDYPRELLEIQVLDDSTDETQQVARACVERHSRAGHAHLTTSIAPIAKATRPARWPNGLKTATGEFIAIFDADFFPQPIFCAARFPISWTRWRHKIGMVQTRWTYLNRHYSLLTEVESILLDGHFVIEHGARSRSGSFFNFNGTAGVWRRTAIDDAGGWQHDTLTEDTDLSYRAQLAAGSFSTSRRSSAPPNCPWK